MLPGLLPENSQKFLFAELPAETLDIRSYRVGYSGKP